MMKKHNFIHRWLPAVLLVCVLLCTATVAGAYLYGQYRLSGTANICINMFFDSLSQEVPAGGGLSPLQRYQEAYNKDHPNAQLPTDPNASEYEWGHVGNPYVISKAIHLENLSRLHNDGFFRENFPKTKTPGAAEDPNDPYSADDIPHFLISTSQYEPAVVGNTTIAPIGTDQYPFFGSVAGVTGTGTTLSCGKGVGTSAIDNLKVIAAPGEIDVGLFGKLGFLGQRPAAGTSNSFRGVPSELENIVFSDIQIAVEQNSVVNTLGHILFKDLFAELQKPAAKAAAGGEFPDPQEDHHLGILVGHVEYAKAKNLSIYYSKPGINALALSNQTSGQNYFCSTGYFGLIDNLNPEYDGTGNLVAGSGLDNGDISYGYGGGGGLLSGTQPGYIRAKELYARFGTALEGPEQDEVVLVRAKDADGSALAQPSIEDHLFWKSTGGYYFYDGIFTFALSDHQDPAGQDLAKLDTIRPIWRKPAQTQKMMVFAQDGYRYQSLPGAAVQIPVYFRCEDAKDLVLVWAEEKGTLAPVSPERENAFLLIPGQYVYSVLREDQLIADKIPFQVTGDMQSLEIPVKASSEDQETTAPTEETTIPTEESTAPAEETTAPTEDAGPEETVAPTEQTAETVPPAEAPSAPAETKSPAAEETEAPTTAQTEAATEEPLKESVPEAEPTDAEPIQASELTMSADEILVPELGIRILPMGTAETERVLTVSLLSDVVYEDVQTETSSAATETTGAAETEASTEAATEPPTEASTEAATEPSTEASTEAATEPSTEASTGAATEPSTEASTEATTEPSTEASTEAATGPSTEASTEPSTEETTEPEMEPVTVKFLCDPIQTSLTLEQKTDTGYEPVLQEQEKEDGITEEINVYRLLPGEYAFSAECPGYEPIVREDFYLDASEPEVQIPLSLVPVPTEPAPEEGSQNSDSAGQPPLKRQEAVPASKMAIPRIRGELRAAPSHIDRIQLSKNWQVEQKGEQTYYYQVLEQIETIEELNLLLDLVKNPASHPESPDIKAPLGFYVGYATTANQKNVIQFMDLTKAQDKDDKGPAAKSMGELIQYTDPDTQKTTDRLRYTDTKDRILDTHYLVDITKNSDNTYEFHGRKEDGTFNKLRLGVFTKYYLIPMNKLQVLTYSQSNGVQHRWDGDYYYDFKFNLNPLKADANGNVPWNLVSWYEKKTVKLDRNGDKFCVGLSLGSQEVPFSIFAVYQDEYINRSDYYYVPKDATVQEFPANEYVLWPNQEYSGSTSGRHHENSYSLRYLPDLQWKDQNGQEIWPAPQQNPDGSAGTLEGLTTMFDLKSMVDWTVQGQLFGFNIGSIGKDGKLLQVPVGTGSYKKNVVIPTGSLAFHINKPFPPEKPAKIRVIVKVPNSAAVPPVKNTLPPDDVNQPLIGDGQIWDYYLGLWKGEERKQGILNFYGFSKDSALKIVEMPLSERMVPTYENPANPDGQPLGPTADQQTKIADRKITVTYPFGSSRPEDTYSTYLQGETVMLAYEFHVTEPGVYILAASDSEMQIAYCSADGIASSGRDGTGGAALGNIDFVYDNGSYVIPVTAAAPPKTPETKENVQKFYFSSNILYHFNNLVKNSDGSYPRTANASAQIYRSIISPFPESGITTQISVQRNGADAANQLVDGITQNHDKVILDGTPQQ